MKRYCLIIALVGLWTGPALANIRAPIKVDGCFSGSIRSLPVSAAVKLLREDLRLVFPGFKPKLSEGEAMVGITAQYEIFNSQGAEIEMSVHFLAVDIQTLTASMDGLALPVEISSDPGERSECLWRLARHRSIFHGQFYRGFLQRIRRAAGLEDSPDMEWLDALEAKDLQGVDPREVFPASGWRSRAANFSSAGMLLRLKPGINKLQVAYSQKMFIDERDYGYSSGWPERGFSGVDYLLYPATSWPLDANFKLAVSAEIPEMPAKRLLGATWLEPGFRSNLTIIETRSERPHVRFLRGEFAGFPADILTILVWFDAKAPRYLSDRTRRP
jgi:hypothetical protein